MYGKLFASTYTGSMYGAGPDVFALWGYVIAHTVDSQVELNPVYLGPLLGMPPERVQAAIDYLCRPDSKSRTKIEAGCRLVREGEYAYRVPTHTQYRQCRDERDRREYMREYQRKRRASRPATPKKPPAPRNGSAPAPRAVAQPYGEFARVRLTAEHHNTLLARLGLKLTEQLIMELDRELEAGGGKLTNGRVVKSCYATILKWAASRKDKTPAAAPTDSDTMTRVWQCPDCHEVHTAPNKHHPSYRQCTKTAT